MLLYAFLSEITMKSFAQCLKGSLYKASKYEVTCFESEHEPTLIQKCCDHVGNPNSSAVPVLASHCQFLVRLES